MSALSECVVQLIYLMPWSGDRYQRVWCSAIMSGTISSPRYVRHVCMHAMPVCSSVHNNALCDHRLSSPPNKLMLRTPFILAMSKCMNMTPLIVLVYTCMCRFIYAMLSCIFKDVKHISDVSCFVAARATSAAPTYFAPMRLLRLV